VATEMLSSEANYAEARTSRLLASFVHALRPDDTAFCARLAFRCGQNVAGSDLCARAGHAERRVARAGHHNGLFPAALSPRADVLGPHITSLNVSEFVESRSW
jgi:hypothetical protein